jgi:hypothetical protein
MTLIEAAKQALEAWQTSVYGSESHHKSMLLAMTNMAQAIAEAEKQESVAWAEEIIADLNALYDSEMITEHDSGDALIRLDAAIAAVEEAEQRHTTPPAAPGYIKADTRDGLVDNDYEENT